MKTALLICSKVPHYRVSVYNHLARRFGEEGWAFKVASEGIHPDNRQIGRFDFRQVAFRFGECRALVEEVRPSVVLFHLHLRDRIFWWLLHWLKLRGTPVVCWTKGGNLDRPDSRWRQGLFNYFHALSDAVILYSDAQRGLIPGRFQSKVFAANNTVNFSEYPEVPESREELRKSLGLPFRRMVLFVGTMGVGGERKKVEHLIEIFRGLGRDDIGLVMVGAGMPESLRQRIPPRNARYLGNVHDPGNVQISRLFKAADLFVVPGHVGLGLNQAFHWGLPVITEDGLQPPEIQYLRDGWNGYKVPQDDVEALKRRMLELLEDDGLRDRFSRNAREGIQRDAPIEGMFRGFLQAVNHAVPGGGRGMEVRERGAGVEAGEIQFRRP